MVWGALYNYFQGGLFSDLVTRNVAFIMEEMDEKINRITALGRFLSKHVFVTTKAMCQNLHLFIMVIQHVLIISAQCSMKYS